MMNKNIIFENTYLGIELGSTRIKAVLTDESVFADLSSDTVKPDKALSDEFDDYLCYYKKGLEGERILGEI